MEKFKNIYRIPSSRLQNWDYGWSGAYFITICTKNRINYFGKIKDGKMILSPLGGVADSIWQEIIDHASNIELGEFVVMPNHVHGILILKNDIHVEKRHAFSLPNQNAKTIGQNRFQNPSSADTNRRSPNI